MTEKKNAGYEWSTLLQNQVVPLVNRLQSFPNPPPPTPPFFFLSGKRIIEYLNHLIPVIIEQI